MSSLAPLKKYLPSSLFKLGTFLKLLKSISLSDALRLRNSQRKGQPHQEIQFKLRALDATLACRAQTSDFHTLQSTFVGHYHLPPGSLPPESIILDLGSNIGYTLVDLGLRYPDATIVGYEMDEENFLLARKNIAGVRNCRIIHQAVAEAPGTVSYDRNSPVDAFSISSGTNTNLESYASVESTSIPEIMKLHNWSRIHYLKMDIEGAEAFLLSENSNVEWLDSVDCINIEIHAPLQPGPFIDLLNRHGFRAWRDTRHWSAVLGVRGESGSI